MNLRALQMPVQFRNAAEQSARQYLRLAHYLVVEEGNRMSSGPAETLHFRNHVEIPVPFFNGLLAMLAPDTFLNEFDHAVMHDKLHHHLAVQAANQHLAQQPVNNVVKLDELLAVRLAEYESSHWSGGGIV